MLNIGSATRIFLSVEATDMRKSFDGLYALVKERMKLDPLNGHLYVFSNRCRTRMKVLYWDGNGLWVCAKRLEQGRFAWPKVSAAENKNNGTLVLNTAEWTLLTEGIDLAQTTRRNWHRIEKTIKE